MTASENVGSYPSRGSNHELDRLPLSLTVTPQPWNKGRLIDQKAPFRQSEIWAIRARLELAGRTRDLALFDLAIDSKLRNCDLVSLRVSDVVRGDHALPRTTILQRKTHQPVQFELSDKTRRAVKNWIAKACLRPDQYLFPSRLTSSPHLSTRQYARIVKGWAILIGLDPDAYGTHSLRRTKASLIYRQTKTLRAVQLLLGHRKLDYVPQYIGSKAR